MAEETKANVQEIHIPDTGDADQVLVVELCVAPGDQVAADDALIVIESDKASMEVPASVAGVVRELLVNLDDEVREGQSIARIEASEEHTAAAAAKPPEPAEQPPKPASRPAAPPDPAPPPPAAQAETLRQASPTATADVYAGPATRRLARELGVDLRAVSGTGARGRIVKDDVKRHVKAVMTAGATGLPRLPEIDFARFGEIEAQPMSRTRVAGARNLHRSWLNLPHVTQHERADVEALEALRASLRSEAQARGLRLSPLAFIVRACCLALKEFPTFNASLDASASHFILKRYYHIGMAVDTEQGLIVPVIRDAAARDVWDLAREIAHLADRARRGRLKMDQLQGGTFSISSLGAIGGTGFTPIINAPEVAILGIGRLSTAPVWDGEVFEPRRQLPLSLSFDHRAINGAEAGRFLACLAELLGNPARLLDPPLY